MNQQRRITFYISIFLFSFVLWPNLALPVDLPIQRDVATGIIIIMQGAHCSTDAQLTSCGCVL